MANSHYASNLHTVVLSHLYARRCVDVYAFSREGRLVTLGSKALLLWPSRQNLTLFLVRYHSEQPKIHCQYNLSIYDQAIMKLNIPKSG